MQMSINNLEYGGSVIFNVAKLIILLWICVWCVCLYSRRDGKDTQELWCNHAAGRAKYLEDWFCGSHVRNHHKQVPASLLIVH